MVGWHHRHNGHEFEQALGVGDGQGGLASDTTQLLNNNNKDPAQGFKSPIPSGKATTKLSAMYAHCCTLDSHKETYF